MAIDFPVPSSVGEIFTDPTSGNQYVCTVVGPPAQWVGAGSTVNLDDTYLRLNTTNDPLTDSLDISGDIAATGDVQSASQNGGPLAGFRNVVINGDLTINQRGVDVATAATGDYGQDRWKKTAGGMTQIIEEGNFEPSATYTLSGTGITTQQLTAPATGDWTIPDVPVTARKIQLEPGPVATPFENRSIGTELELCQRYYLHIGNGRGQPVWWSGSLVIIGLSGYNFRTAGTVVNGGGTFQFGYYISSSTLINRIVNFVHSYNTGDPYSYLVGDWGGDATGLTGSAAALNFDWAIDCEL